MVVRTNTGREKTIRQHLHENEFKGLTQVDSKSTWTVKIKRSKTVPRNTTKPGRAARGQA